MIAWNLETLFFSVVREYESSLILWTKKYLPAWLERHIFIVAILVRTVSIFMKSYKNCFWWRHTRILHYLNISRNIYQYLYLYSYIYIYRHIKIWYNDSFLICRQYNLFGTTHNTKYLFGGSAWYFWLTCATYVLDLGVACSAQTGALSCMTTTQSVEALKT